MSVQSRPELESSFHEFHPATGEPSLNGGCESVPCSCSESHRSEDVSVADSEAQGLEEKLPSDGGSTHSGPQILARQPSPEIQSTNFRSHSGIESEEQEHFSIERGSEAHSEFHSPRIEALTDILVVGDALDQSSLAAQDTEAGEITQPSNEGTSGIATKRRCSLHINIEDKLAWLLVLLAGVWLLFTNFYLWSVASNSWTRIIFPAFSQPAQTQLIVLRVLTEIGTLFLNAIIASSAAVAMWTALSSRRGLTISTLLAMSPATGWWGLFRLFWWKHDGTVAHDFHHPWIIAR